MRIPEDVTADVRRRLHRAAGQIGGVERMLDAGRDCKEAVAQISAATKAVEQAGLRLVAEGLTYCIGSPEEAKADGYDVESVLRMFMRLA